MRSVLWSGCSWAVSTGCKTNCWSLRVRIEGAGCTDCESERPGRVECGLESCAGQLCALSFSPILGRFPAHGTPSSSSHRVSLRNQEGDSLDVSRSPKFVFSNSIIRFHQPSQKYNFYLNCHFWIFPTFKIFTFPF